uniref:Anaphase-promoting complex subunit 4 n=1 Tax=Timema cristinae TaxID=61476 RepID=A0A7R9D110_TIMCR|nr:unnamed protein product [Timema cristinae]
MSSTNPMRQLEERHLATQVELMVWSDKMDLLALANARGEVALHRLTWQKVWSLPPPSDHMRVNTMAWRPDGKVIAIGYNTSEVVLVDVETKETLYKVSVENAITFVSWVEEKSKPQASASSIQNLRELTGDKPYNVDNSSNFLPKLPSLSRNFGSEQEDNLEDSKKIKDQINLNILMIGTAVGKLFLRIFGMFPCGVVNVGSYTEGRWSGVKSAQFSDNLSQLFIAVGLNKGETSHQEVEDLALVCIKTPIFTERSTELRSLALKHAHIISLMRYLSQTMHSITEAWENILLEMDIKLASYAAKVPEGLTS